jgi:hypothetical protein
VQVEVNGTLPQQMHTTTMRMHAMAAIQEQQPEQEHAGLVGLGLHAGGAPLVLPTYLDGSLAASHAQRVLAGPHHATHITHALWQGGVLP